VRVHGATLITAATFVLTALACDEQSSKAPAVLETWFRHIERNEIDSLRPLLTSDFVFVSDGRTWGADAFVAMIAGLGIRNPRVRLTDVVAHERDGIAYLVYRRDETFQMGGATETVPEVGSMVLVRQRGTWQIAQWTATSPPSHGPP
jgi:hypothetical protein